MMISKTLEPTNISTIEKEVLTDTIHQTVVPTIGDTLKCSMW